jgi:peptidoglycan/xylan/chitin deacetylase (PgdA/CDA1 family)
VSQQATRSERALVSYLARARQRLTIEAARTMVKKRLVVKTSVPLVSFTFDDFPRSAFLEAGSILSRYGARGTYYASLSLMGQQSPMGTMFEAADLKELLDLGHELGCHTFGHCHSLNTPPEAYERAIVENQETLTELLPGVKFQTFAYPYSAPSVSVKRVAGRHFLCCRGGGLRPGRYFARSGGQTFNSGITDLNLLCAVFLEKSGNNPEAIKSLIDQNSLARGWLILATHDVRESPSPFGCTPHLFQQVVQWSLESGAQILPVVEALQVLQGIPRQLTTAERLVGGRGALTVPPPLPYGKAPISGVEPVNTCTPSDLL